MSYNIAIFISGRVIYYDTQLLEVINRIETNSDYNIKLFFSINTLSLGKDESPESITDNLKQIYKDKIGCIYWETFKYPASYINNKILNNNLKFYINDMSSISTYAQLSCIYNDKKNFENINTYEKQNNIIFDIICKVRSEMILTPESKIRFNIHNNDSLVIYNKHFCDIRLWGHVYKYTPYVLLTDTFVYGNKKSMEIYCRAYDWMLEQDIIFKGNYYNCLEIILTESVLNHVFYNIPGGGAVPTYSEEYIINKFSKNMNNLMIVRIPDEELKYSLMPNRAINNFRITIDNFLNYTHSLK
jgi:hypothetical protein